MTSYNFTNKLNAFMDHGSSNFYKSQERMSRFVSLVRTNKPDIVNVSYTGTPPAAQLFGLYGATETDFLKVRVDFTDPLAMRVYLNGKVKPQNELKNGVMQPLTGARCGENRWDSINAVLEFTLQGGDSACEVEVKALESIQLTVRMNSTVDDFFATEGELSYIERLALQLGIATNRIKIVGVYTGSVVVDSEILSNEELPDYPTKIEEL